jgi:L-asparaginase
MAGEIHAADAVAKVHASAIGAFGSPDLGPIGFFSDEGVAIRRMPARRRRLPRLPEHAVEPVVLITAVMGMGGGLARAAVRDGARGVVIAATGVGNTTPVLLAACRDAIGDGIPVLLATRCPAGAARPQYGFPGGGRAWEAAGAIFVGHLHPLKARVALALGLGAGMSEREFRELFRE